MKILKLFGIGSLITPGLILLVSLLFNVWMPFNSFIFISIMMAIPTFVSMTLIKGLYKVLKLVWG